MKIIPLNEMKKGDWSLNVEDESYVENREEILNASIDALLRTKPNHFVNIITPGGLGHPEEWFIPSLRSRLTELNIPVEGIQYIDECGCGGHVTRIFR